MGLEFQTGRIRKAVFLAPLRYQPDLQINGPSTHNLAVSVIGADFVRTSDGYIPAWKVKVGDEATAWYEVQAPHRLLRLEGAYEWLVLK
jgi:hypothetical protein